jgi:hypothetical protein
MSPAQKSTPDQPIPIAGGLKPKGVNLNINPVRAGRATNSRPVPAQNQRRPT